MKLLVVFALAFAAVSADVSELSEKAAEILGQELNISPDGETYNYYYKTGNGIEANAEGQTIDVGGNPAQQARGSFRYTAPRGEPIGLTWTAGVEGYNAVGDSIPTPPPTPDLILRLINYLAENARTAPPRSSVAVQ